MPRKPKPLLTPLTGFDAPLEPVAAKLSPAPASERLLAPIDQPPGEAFATLTQTPSPVSPEAPLMSDDLEALFSPSSDKTLAPTAQTKPQTQPPSAGGDRPSIDVKLRLAAQSSAPRKAPEQASAVGRDGRVDLGVIGSGGGVPASGGRQPLAVRRAYLFAGVASVIWAGCMWAFALNYQNPFGAFEYRPFAMTAFAGLCLLPPIFISMAAYALKQAFGLARETELARRMADDLVLPAALASERAAGAVRVAEAEVERAAAIAGDAERQILGLRKLLAEEGDRLLEAADHAERRAQALSRGLAREREQMSGLAETLGASVEAVNAAIQSQSQLVAEASDLATAQIQEAEAGLVASTAGVAEALAASLDAAQGVFNGQAQLVAEISDLATAQLGEAEAVISARAVAFAEVVEASIEAANEAMEAQSRLVADASDAAANVIRDAEVALTARTNALNDAAGNAAETTALAGESLDAHAQNLRAAGAAAAGAASAASDAVSAERERLVALAEGLRADQDHILGRIEAHKALILEASGDARAAADELTTASEQGAAVLRDLAAEAAAHVSELFETAQSQAAALSRNAETGLKLFSGFVAEERAALEAETQSALQAVVAAAAGARAEADAQLERARRDYEALGEAATAAGQTADQAFDHRLQAAHRLIEGSVTLVDDAGRRSAESIEAGLSATRFTVAELRGLLEDIDEKARALPTNAQHQIDALRSALASGIGDLTSAARSAAEETRAIDAAFQNRIRENYQILSEALRLMSRAAASTAAQAPGAAARIAASSAPAAAPAPISADREIRLAPSQSPPVVFRQAGGVPEPLPVAAPAPAMAAMFAQASTSALKVESPATPQSSGEALGLRPRLRLTPEGPPQSPAPPVLASSLRADLGRDAPLGAGRPATGGDWSWKDLLSSIDEPPLDDDVLADRMISAIEGLGLDAPTLLPLSRIDEIAAAVQTGDVTGVKEAVRACAPSAVRRLSRRVLTDHVLRAQADRYLRRYEELLTDSARRDRDGFMTATLLGSDPGRAFLLFKAAVGELH